MTVIISLDPPSPSPSYPSSLSSTPVSTPARAGPSRTTFESPSSHPSGVLEEVVRNLRNCRRIVVVCGAGISTAASIPDFRSSSGLFARDTKGKHTMRDLFHARCLSSPTLLAAHHALISELASLSISSYPTPFHRYLNSLDQEERLLRVYTQNIDGLEEKAGLSLGIPPIRSRSPRKIKHPQAPLSPPSSPSRNQTPFSGRIGTPPPSQPPVQNEPLSEPAIPSYRVIPLHGSLSTLHCSVCFKSLPLIPHLPLPSHPMPCPTCEESSTIRSALFERPRRSGHLRASVILYGEVHQQGEAIGQVVERDLRGTGPKDLRDGRVDFLLVTGTSLTIPGVKRIVKEMAASLHHRTGDEIKTVYINDESPRTAGEWEDVFDVFIKGDIQMFLRDYLDNPEYVVTPSTPKKRKSSAPATSRSKSNATPGPTKKRRKMESRDEHSSDITTPTKVKRARQFPLTPRPTPPKRAGKEKADSPARRDIFEGSLTPLSEVEGGEMENPFLDIGSHLKLG